MTLINCKECNNKISHEAYQCPKCGWPVNETYVKEVLKKLKNEEKKEREIFERKARKYFEDNKDKILLKIRKNINSINEKKRYKEINKFLNKDYMNRPILSCFTPLKQGGIMFTDGYQLFILNDDYLYEKVAFTKDYKPKEKDEYLKKYNLFCIEECYPSLDTYKPVQKYYDNKVVSVEEFLLEMEILKKIRKNKNDMLIYEIKFENGKISCDAQRVKKIIDILMIKDKICFEKAYGNNGIDHLVIRNSDKESAILLPIKTY